MIYMWIVNIIDVLNYYIIVFLLIKNNEVDHRFLYSGYDDTWICNANLGHIFRTKNASSQKFCKFSIFDIKQE